ncbi:hypothetical protein ma539 [Moumouvirus australiensis]|uniref:Uncharacterized protein n=1 Tax=Moumouvirus australiensis TaxID=2109587 RepID=A0A2P1EM14_9VIRU|nr:hypothetical protein QKC55_gp366 [Moumouvirus australiensis]AVL94925.1 hypothetical protein ma539 [Moumouvirus australiensis]
MSYKNQLIKQVTDGKYDRKKYINMVNKKNNSNKNNYRSNTNNIDETLLDLLNKNKVGNEFNKTLEDYNKPDTPENKSPELIPENDEVADTNNETSKSNNENISSEEKFTENNPRRPNRPLNKKFPIRNINAPIKNNHYTSRDLVNKQLIDKISLLEAKIDKLEAKVKILNLQMNSFLQNDN